MDVTKMLQEEIARYEKAILTIQAHLETAGKGRLRVSNCRKWPQYYIDGHYAGKSELQRVQDLAQCQYEKELLSRLRILVEKLKEVSGFYEEEILEKIYTGLCDGKKKLIRPMFPEKKEFIERWISEAYDKWEIRNFDESGREKKEESEPAGNNKQDRREFLSGTESDKPVLPEQKDRYRVKGEYYTLAGERVRSKSEKIIADEFSRFQIPYRYEYPLSVKDKKTTRTIRPVFLVLNRRTLQEYIVEHLGMMDDAEYQNRTIQKLDLYERNGYMIGKNLLLFHETAESPLNMRVVDSYIREFMI